MIKKTFLLLLGLFIIMVLIVAFFIYIPKSVINTTVSGFHLRSEHWSGTITIVGHTRFVPWATLTIEPGTKVLFNKNPDIPNSPWTQFADAYIKDHNDPTGHEGYNQSHFDLAARIVAIGTKDQPIIFTSAQAKPEYADWDELVLFGGSILDHVELSYSHNGVYVGTEGVPFEGGKPVTITNSTFHDSLWSCIDVWSVDSAITNNEIYHCWHQAIGIKGKGTDVVEGNNIHDALLSINCENGAKPEILNNHFKAAPMTPECGTGVNNKEETKTSPDTKGGTYNGILIYPSQ